MDLLMPGGIDGIETTRHLRMRSPHTQVVVLTAFTDDARVVAALREGATGYVRKDAAPEVLLSAVRGALRCPASLRFRASATACATASPVGGVAARAAEVSTLAGIGAGTDALTLTCDAVDAAVDVPTEIVICSGITIVALSEGMLSPEMLELFDVSGLAIPVFESVDTVMAAVCRARFSKVETTGAGTP